MSLAIASVGGGMSGGGYRRATKKHPTRVEHTDGDTTEGFLLVPIGLDFSATLSQMGNFMPFELKSGEETFLNVTSIKRVTETGPAESEPSTTRASNEERAGQKAQSDEQKAREQEEAAKEKAEAAAKRAKRRASPYSKPEEYDALDILGLGEFASREEIQSAYRRLVKLYHPDRLRGLGVSASKITYAEQRLADINNSYRLLMSVVKAA